MRVFVAGASGVIGVALVPLLTEAGHVVAGMTRTPQRAVTLVELGAEPVVCDVYDAGTLTAAVIAFAPDAVIHQLTDLPDDAREIAAHAQRHVRIRDEGTRKLLAAARASGAHSFLAQSIAWELEGERQSQHEAFEQQVLDAGGVVIRYGQLYGPGTYYEDELPDPPRISVQDAARRTVPLLMAPAGVVELVDD
ncbi:MAG: NAD-dependent epimerase/dehydratase family protein [Solirubrobacteraceae bacterium]